MIPSSYRNKGIALGFVPIIIIGLVLGIYLSLTVGSNNPIVNYSSFTATAETANSTLGLELDLSVNSTTIQSGQAINVSVSITNTLQSLNNVSANLFWALPSLANFSSSPFPCPQWYSFLVFSGYYTVSDISKASDPLYLFPPGVEISCPFRTFSQFIFHPLSSQFNTSTTNPPDFDLVDNSNQTFSITGYYTTAQGYVTSNGILPPPPFPQGVYTIVAGDEWGQLVLLHFAGL